MRNLSQCSKVFKEIKVLIAKDLVVEWRNRYAINGILLYLISTIFICYLSFNLQQNQLSIATWNALFWIIMLFTSINAVVKSFLQESSSRFTYYYAIASPEAIILSKIIYNSLLMILLGGAGYLFYSLVLGNPVEDHGLFVLNLILASIGFSSSLTMISGIVSKAGQNTTLMAVLSFPIVLPLLLVVIRVSKNAINGISGEENLKHLLVLVSINVIVGTVSYLLFPYLWRS